MYIAVLAQVLGVILGLFAALMRMSKLWVLRLLSDAYTLVLRGTPVIVQIFFIYYGANLLLGVTIIPNTLNFVCSSRRRGSVRGHPRARHQRGRLHARDHSRRHRRDRQGADGGSAVARDDLGLAMRRIVLPQAARVIVPPLGNEFNNMLKTTSLLAFIGLTELFGDAEIHYSQTFKPVEYFTAVAFWYLVLTTIWSLIQARIERKLGASDRGDELSMRERFAGAWSPVGAWARR